MNKHSFARTLLNGTLSLGLLVPMLAFAQTWSSGAVSACSSVRTDGPSGGRVGQTTCQANYDTCVSNGGTGAFCKDNAVTIGTNMAAYQDCTSQNPSYSGTNCDTLLAPSSVTDRIANPGNYDGTASTPTPTPETTSADPRQTFYGNDPTSRRGQNLFTGAGCYSSLPSGVVSETGQYIYQGQPQSGTCFAGDTYLGANGQTSNPGNLAYTPLEPLPGMPVGVGNTALSTMLNYAFRVLLTLGAMFAVGSLVLGGIVYMTSEVVGDKNFARKRIQASLLGLLLLLAAWLILYTVNPQLVTFSNSLNPSTMGSSGIGANATGCFGGCLTPAQQAAADANAASPITQDPNDPNLRAAGAAIEAKKAACTGTSHTLYTGMQGTADCGIRYRTCENIPSTQGGVVYTCGSNPLY